MVVYTDINKCGKSRAVGSGAAGFPGLLNNESSYQIFVLSTSVPDQGNSLSRMLTLLRSSMCNRITLNPFKVGDKDGLYIWPFGMSAPDDVAQDVLSMDEWWHKQRDKYITD